MRYAIQQRLNAFKTIVFQTDDLNEATNYIDKQYKNLHIHPSVQYRILATADLKIVSTHYYGGEVC